MKILASDFDGTLYRGAVSQKDREAIAAFRSVGNLFGIVTGRDYTGIRTLLIAESVELDFLILMNGATAKDSDGNTIFSIEADGACAVQIADYIRREFGHSVCAIVDDKRITVGDTIPAGGWEASNASRAQEVGRFSMMNTLLDTPDDARRAAEYINCHFNRYVNALQNFCHVDMPPAGVDKGEGIARYAETVGVSSAHVWCAGDNLNDMAMITRFHGCAVANSMPEIKDAAKGVYDSICDIIDAITDKK